MRVFSSRVAPVMPNTGHRAWAKAGAHPGRVKPAPAGNLTSTLPGWSSLAWLVLLRLLLLPGPVKAGATAAARDEADDDTVAVVGDVNAAITRVVGAATVALRRLEVRSPDKGWATPASTRALAATSAATAATALAAKSAAAAAAAAAAAVAAAGGEVVVGSTTVATAAALRFAPRPTAAAVASAGATVGATVPKAAGGLVRAATVDGEAAAVVRVVRNVDGTEGDDAGCTWT